MNASGSQRCPPPTVVLTEFGEATFERADGEAWFGYGTVTTEQDFADRLGSLVGAAVESGLAGYCYIQFTDTLQETNGLLTPERRTKIPLADLRAILTRAPRGRR